MRFGLFFQAPARAGIFSSLPDSYREHLPRLRHIRETIADLPYDRFCRDQAVFGDAAEVVDRLQAAREEFGLSQIICWFDQGAMLPRPEVERVMRAFAEQVMPKLRRARGPRSAASREALRGGSCRRGDPAGSASVTHSPDSPIFERRTGLGGPTPAARQNRPDATRRER
jgi:hypothetical protein